MADPPMVTFNADLGSSGSGNQTAAQRRRNRTNYRCSKCGQPKRGHVCPYQPRIVRAEGEKAPDTRTVGCQVEIDSRLVVRHLNLEAQGLPESYGEEPGTILTAPPADDIPPLPSPVDGLPPAPVGIAPAAATAVSLAEPTPMIYS